MKKVMLFVLLTAAIAFLSSCKREPPVELTPQSFMAAFASLTSDKDEKAIAAFEGNTYQLNVKVEGVVSDEYVLIRCSENAKIKIYAPPQELQEVKNNDIIAFEGTVKEVNTETWNDRFSTEMIMEDAHVTARVFEITGCVEELCQDASRGGQIYASIWDNSVVLERQINIYLPQNHGLEIGDSFTTRGTLLYPAYPDEFTVGYIKGRGFPEVYVMPEPEYIRKEEIK